MTHSDGELIVVSQTVVAGTLSVGYRVRNLGSLMLFYGADFEVDGWTGRMWSRVSPSAGHRLVTLQLFAIEGGAESRELLAQLQRYALHEGRYRLRKKAWVGDPDAEEVEITGLFEVPVRS